MTKYADPAIVALLRAFGHSTAKAVEIALDYARRDEHAIRWVHIIQRQMGAAQ